MIPEWTTQAAFERALEAAGRPANVRLETFDEGRSVQTLHLGSFDDEGSTLARMHDEVIPGRGLRMTGRHHEIYLSDLRKVEPGKCTPSAQVQHLAHEHLADAGEHSVGQIYARTIDLDDRVAVVVEKLLGCATQVHERVEIGTATRKLCVECRRVRGRIGEHEAIALRKTQPRGQVPRDPCTYLRRRPGEHDPDHRVTAGTRASTR